MAPGILSSILDTTGTRVQERIQQSNEMDKAMRDTQTKALLDSIYASDPTTGAPKLSDAEAEEAWGRIEKLNGHNKGAKDILTKARDITGKIFGTGRNANPAMAERAKTQTAQALSGGGGGALVSAPPQPDLSTPGPDADAGAAETYSGLTPPPARASATPTAPVGPPTPPQRTSTIDLMRAGAPPNENKLKIDAEDRANKEWSRREDITSGHKLDQIKTTASSHGDKKIAQYTGEDGKLHLIFQAADGTKYETDSEGNVRPYANRLSPGAHLSVTDAQSLAQDLHQQFLDEKGDPYDVTKLKIQDELIPITGGLPNRYKIATQGQSTITANNVVSAVPNLEKTNPNAAVPLGAAQVARTGTSEAPMLDASGNPIAVTLNSTSTPVTPTTQQTPSVPGGPAAPPPRSVVTPPPAASSGSRPLEGFSGSEFNTQSKKATALKAAGAQIFGDPSDPNSRGLAYYAPLMDDAGARERVGTAARMVIQDLASADSKGGGIGASLLGTGASLHGGDLWGAIKNWSGATEAIGKQQAAATDAAIAKLKPEEKDMLNAIMASYGTIMGLRSITSAGAYKFSAEAMEREIPVPGRAGVVDSRSYKDKMARLAQEMVTGSDLISDKLLPEKAMYKSMYEDLSRQAHGGLTPPPARSSAPNNDNTPAVAASPTTYSIIVNGKPAYFKSQQDLDNFKKAAHIQ